KCRWDFADVMSEREKDGAEDDDDPYFDQGGPVLQVGAFAGAPDVHGGDHGDHGNRNRGGFHGGEGNNFVKIAGEGASERCDGTAGDYEEETPTVEECGHATEAITDKNVKTAGLGIGRSELGIRERAEKRENAADDPDKEGVADGAIELTK